MYLLEVLRERYSARAYSAEPVEEEKLQAVLEAARMAPTAANRQPFRVMVLPTAGRQEELARIYGRPWFVQAPLVLGVCAVLDEAWRRMDSKPYDEVDATIAMDHMILAATGLGLGTCWVAAFDPEAAREVLALPDGVDPIAFTPLGYATDQPKPKKRRPLEELVKHDRW